MASHRMPEEERPRRAVPAWVTAPPEAPTAALEAHPTPDTSAPAPGSAGPVTSFPAPSSAPVPGGVAPAPGPAQASDDAPRGGTIPGDASSIAGAAVPATAPAPGPVDDEVVVPDYPPEQDLLPPAPTSPTVHTSPLERRLVSASDAGSPLLGPAPVSPIDAVAYGGPSTPAVPVVPVVGQPRFSVPGLEHVVVAGAEPEQSGPIGYRTPARFAHQQRPLVAPAQTPPTERSFDAVLAPPTAHAPTAPSGPRTPPVANGPTPSAGSARARAATVDTVAMPTATEASATVTGSPEAEPSLQARSSRRGRVAPDATDDADEPGRPLVGVTPGAVIGAVAGLMTLGVAAWWFTAPATVHAVGLVLGVLAVLLSVTVLRNPAVTWQRPVALLGAVLGGVGALVLLWAVASALLSSAGVALPDLTGTGTVPTLAP